MSFLLDTNVLSEVTRPQPDRKVLTWLSKNVNQSYVSVLSMGEIWNGVESLPKGRRRTNYENWFLEQTEDFKDRIISLELSVVIEWGTYSADQAKAGHKVGVIDSLIAATALAHNLTLATRNIRDFPNVSTLNPWK